jgi:hypothetical protein
LDFWNGSLDAEPCATWASLTQMVPAQETDKKFQETNKKMDRLDEQIEETNRIIGRLGNKLGEFVEGLVRPGLVRRFMQPMPPFVECVGFFCGGKR